MLSTGVVIWFDVKRGYGFISSSQGDIFVHLSGVKGSCVLSKGDEVEFKTEKHERGMQAKDVVIQNRVDSTSRVLMVTNNSLRRIVAKDKDFPFRGRVQGVCESINGILEDYNVYIKEHPSIGSIETEEESSVQQKAEEAVESWENRGELDRLTPVDS